jgi:hypothetical protein
MSWIGLSSSHSETRNYVQRVTECRCRYRWLVRNADHAERI